MPSAVRPWQHVLDALSGYLLLAEHLAGKDGMRYSSGWNFGPAAADHLNVGDIAGHCARLWGGDARVELGEGNFQHETECLRLNAARACTDLGWRQRWSAIDALERTIAWYRAWYAGPPDANAVRRMTLAQIDDYSTTP
jgi:CDP-glucose 4,6-dehydratase